MLKLQTPVEVGKSRNGISYKDKILVLGSCFADNVGDRMAAYGFDVCVNPFGTLYNPASIANSINRLASAEKFTASDCEQMGSGSPLFCSFSHHTSFARQTMEEFLDNANARLDEASIFFRECNRIIITLGTSWCFRHTQRDEIVSNCLKRDAKEFVREFMDARQSSALLSGIVKTFGHAEHPLGHAGLVSAALAQKKFILTVSPIRHMKDGAHGNQLSKAGLLLAIDEICRKYPDVCEYFPSYEIMMDELRDYRFYADDMVHPSGLAVNYIWERFMDFALPADEFSILAARQREYRRSCHIPNTVR